MSDERRGPLRPSGPPLGGDREIQYSDHAPWWRRHLPLLIAVVVLIVVVGGITGAVLATRNLGTVSASDGGSASSSASSSVSGSGSASGSASSSGSVSGSPPVSGSPSASASSSAPAPPAPVQSSADGSVVAIAGTQWTVEVQKGLQITVVITPASVFPRGKTIADVIVGTKVSVSGGLLNGVLTAIKVTIEK